MKEIFHIVHTTYESRQTKGETWISIIKAALLQYLVFKRNCRDFFFYKKQHKMHIFKLFIKKSKTGNRYTCKAAIYSIKSPFIKKIKNR